MEGKSPIQRFFTGKNIVITGSTGTCGRIFLEKILRTLLDIGTIFLIIRSKQNLTANERVKKLLSRKLFSMRSIEKSQFEKIVVVEGDVCSVGLRMTEEHQKTLIDKANFVFHAAASVRFTATFRDNFISNVIGTENMLKFASRFRNLECFVHISTAYSNCQLSIIDETLYSLSEDVYTLVEKFRSMDEKTLENEGPKYFDGRPNNYTFTKALAEHVVNSFFPNLPVAIARPAIVASCTSEPTPGLTDSMEGPAALGLAAALGILKVTDWNFNNRCEVFPIDYLANSLIAIAYNARKKNEKLQIYNLVSSPLNEWPNDYEMLVLARNYTLQNPSIYAIRNPMAPPLINRMSDTEYKIKRFFLHTLLAFFIDLMLMMVGRKRMMQRMVRKMHTGLDVMKYFSLHQWTFLCDNYKSMIDEMSEDDERIFPIDISKVDYIKQTFDTMEMVRIMFLNDDRKFIPVAKLKLKM